MGLPKEVLAHAIRSSPVPEKAAELIAKYERQRDRVIARKRKTESIQQSAERQIKSLMDEVLCNHEVTKRHGDPSGNGDTQDECLICGEWIREKAVRFT